MDVNFPAFYEFPSPRYGGYEENGYTNFTYTTKTTPTNTNLPQQQPATSIYHHCPLLNPCISVHTTIYIVFQGQKQHISPPAGPSVLISQPRCIHHKYVENLTDGPFHVQHLSSTTQILAERCVNKEFHESLPNYIFFIFTLLLAFILFV